MFILSQLYCHWSFTLTKHFCSVFSLSQWFVTWCLRHQAVTPPQGKRAGRRPSRSLLKPNRDEWIRLSRGNTIRTTTTDINTGKKTHYRCRAEINTRIFFNISAKSYPSWRSSCYHFVSCTWSWESGLPRGFCFWDSLRLRGCSRYSGIWDEACPALLFLGLSFCLWAQEVKSWLVLPTEQVRVSRNIISLMLNVKS